MANKKRKTSKKNASATSKTKKSVKSLLQNEPGWHELSEKELGFTPESPIYVKIDYQTSVGGASPEKIAVSFMSKESSSLEANSVESVKLLELAAKLARQAIGSDWVVGDVGPYPYDVETGEPLEEGTSLEEYAKRQDRIWWKWDIELAKGPMESAHLLRLT